MTLSVQKFGILHTGGTLGCAGEPLAPLSGEVFLPLLHRLLMQWHPAHWQLTQLPTLLDSSQIQPSDWLAIWEHCLHLYQQGIQHLIIIHGTDTLAYSAAFLAEAFAGSDLHISITGSQQPLLDQKTYQINPHSDAHSNIMTAIQAIQHRPAGISVAFAGQIWQAQTVQKMHTQAFDAFSGEIFSADVVENTPIFNQHVRKNWLAHSQQQLLQAKKTIETCQIAVYYAVPATTTHIIAQLQAILTKQPDALILLGYGSGNFPQHPSIQHLLEDAILNGTLIILATQVPFGGTSIQYASADWLATLGALPASKLTIATIYARLYWICTQHAHVQQRQQAWLAPLETP